MTMFLSQPTTIAPGSGPAPAPAPAQPSQGAPAAPAAPMDGPFGGSMILLLPILMIAFSWFLTNRQNAKQKEVEAALKPGDMVVTQSGLIGKIVDLGEVNAKLEIAPGVNVRVRKSTIQGLESEPKATEAAAKDKAADKSNEKANEKKA